MADLFAYIIFLLYLCARRGFNAICMHRMRLHSRHILFLLLFAICALCVHADQTPPPSAYKPLPFSVSPDKQITFSSGNLQYNAAQGSHLCADGSTQPGTWRFAEHQYDYVGDAENGNVYQNGVKCNNELISDTYDGWIDLFGWGTSGWNSGANTWQPWATSRIQEDYYPGGSEENNLIGDYAYADWGQYNAVGDDPAGTWRTLTNEEWNYLFRSRDNAELLFGLGTVDDVPGVILLPDDWVTPPGVSFNASTDKGLSWQGRYYENNTDNNYSHNTYTSKQWEEQMAVNGAVFLPATGYRYETDVYYMSTQYTGEYGSYWSSSANDTVYAYDCNFSISLLRLQHPALRYGGRSVRLVKDIPTAPPSAYRSLPFSVSADKQVWFSSGNLQYNAARMTHQCADGTTQPGTWRFAKHQYDFVGDAEEGTIYVNGIKCDNAQISDSYIGWIDLFGWGTSGWNSGANMYQPWASSPTNSDYNPGNNENNDLTGDYAYSDWSVYNQIGKSPAGAWRTLAKDEWEYLFCERENADKLFGLGTVNGVQGAILLPDEWTMPDGATFTPSTEKGLEWNGTSYESSTKDLYTHNSYTASQWVIMEAAGAVFLPAGGGRSGITVNYVAESGNYWTTTHNTEEDAFRTHFYTHYLNPSYHSGRHLGRTVRPVSDVPLPPPSTYEPKPFSVSADKQVLFSSGNLQYNAALGAHVSADGTIQPGTWRFAEHQWDYVGDAENGTVYQYNLKCDNALISETYDGWIDLFGWGTSGWNSGANAYQPWATNQANSDYSPCEAGENNLTGSCAYADWGVYNPIGNAPAGTWRTLTSEEWLYLFRERQNAEKLFGLGTVNGVPGTIILPDDWTTPTDVIFTPSTDKDLKWEESNYTNSNEDNYSHNTYTSKQWEEQMEANGAVFLPATGYRYGTKVSYTGAQKTGGYGSFWSSSADDGTHAYDVNFSISSLRPQYSAIRYGARAVRLVKDHTPPPPQDQCTDVVTEFSYTVYKGETYQWENTEYKTAGDYTKTYPKADGCDSIVTLHLTVLPPECLGNYDTVRFCSGLNIEHDEVVRHGYCIRYLPYRYESPAEWDFMEDVILVRDSARTLVDLARAERNLKEHYTEDLTPVQSVSWSLRKEGTHEYHAITVQSEAQWIEAGTLSLSVYFLCGQRYYSDFTTDIDNINVSDKPVKILMDGHIYILRGDHIFDTQGKAVK